MQREEDDKENTFDDDEEEEEEAEKGSMQSNVYIDINQPLRP